MIFLASKVAELLLRPSTVLVLCCVAGLLFRRRWLLRLGVWGFVAALLLPVDQLALLPLEDRFPRPPAPAQVDGIIVLGGAVEPDLTQARGIPSLNGAAERMTEGVALARRFPQARLVFTGGSGALIPGGPTEADTARTLFLALGVPSERLVTERVSRTTWENARDTKALLRPQPGQIWLVVTSAAHMPRAVGAFRSVGWYLTAWPVAYKSGMNWRLWLPSSLEQHLGSLDEAAHEWVGLLAYYLLGHSTALFPAP